MGSCWRSSRCLSGSSGRPDGGRSENLSGVGRIFAPVSGRSRLALRWVIIHVFSWSVPKRQPVGALGISIRRQHGHAPLSSFLVKPPSKIFHPLPGVWHPFTYVCRVDHDNLGLRIRSLSQDVVDVLISKCESYKDQVRCFCGCRPKVSIKDRKWLTIKSPLVARVDDDVPLLAALVSWFADEDSVANPAPIDGSVKFGDQSSG